MIIRCNPRCTRWQQLPPVQHVSCQHAQLNLSTRTAQCTTTSPVQQYQPHTQLALAAYMISLKALVSCHTAAPSSCHAANYRFSAEWAARCASTLSVLQCRALSESSAVYSRHNSCAAGVNQRQIHSMGTQDSTKKEPWESFCLKPYAAWATTKA